MGLINESKDFDNNYIMSLCINNKELNDAPIIKLDSWQKN